MNEFLDELASSSPAPGGGSVSALCGSLGAALDTMVCNLTIGKKKYADVSEEMEELKASSEELRKSLYELIDKDAEAFNEVMRAFKMPKETEEQKSVRKQAIQKAFKGAAEVPLEVAGKCLEVLEVSAVLAEKGNKNAVSDAAVSALVARAGLQGALLNVKINLGSIKDREFNSRMLDRSEELDHESSELLEDVLEEAEEKLSVF